MSLHQSVPTTVLAVKAAEDSTKSAGGTRTSKGDGGRALRGEMP